MNPPSGSAINSRFPSIRSSRAPDHCCSEIAGWGMFLPNKIKTDVSRWNDLENNSVPSLETNSCWSGPGQNKKKISYCFRGTCWNVISGNQKKRTEPWVFNPSLITPRWKRNLGAIHGHLPCGISDGRFVNHVACQGKSHVTGPARQKHSKISYVERRYQTKTLTVCQNCRAARLPACQRKESCISCYDFST